MGKNYWSESDFCWIRNKTSLNCWKQFGESGTSGLLAFLAIYYVLKLFMCQKGQNKPHGSLKGNDRIFRNLGNKLSSNFSCSFLNPNDVFSDLNSNCSKLLDLRNIQEQVKKAFCYQKLFWPFTVWINCSCDLKHFKFFSITRTIFSHSRSEQFW